MRNYHQTMNNYIDGGCTIISDMKTVAELLAEVHEDTVYSSNHNERFAHTSMQEVVKRGESAIPELLDLLGSWESIIALRQITNDTGPQIHPRDFGRFDRVTATWRVWGKEYLSQKREHE